MPEKNSTARISCFWEFTIILASWSQIKVQGYYLNQPETAWQRTQNMWMLRGASEENADFCLRLRPGRKYAVGRKDVDVNIKHSSVSRAHATLSVSTWSKTETPSTVTLDDTSAQGSFICQSSAASTDFVRVKSTLLKKGTLLKFAKCPQLFSLLYEPLTICPSSLSPLVLSELNALATANEILVSTDWSDDVGAIITKPSKITAKPILAMASALPIVTIDWIKAIDAAPDLSFAQPDTEPWASLSTIHMQNSFTENRIDSYHHQLHMLLETFPKTHGELNQTELHSLKA